MNRLKYVVITLLTCLLLTSCGTDETQISEITSETPIQSSISNSEISPFTENKSIQDTKTETTFQTLISSESETSPDLEYPNGNDYIDEINALMKNELLSCAPDESYDLAVGDKDFYEEASTKYAKLLGEFLDFPEKYEKFGGAFVQNGYLHLLITDKEYSDNFLEIVGNENVIIAECSYSYSYLNQVYEFISSFELDSENGSTSYILSENKNRVLVTVLSEDVKSDIYSAIEKEGFDKSAVDIIVADYVFANPV